jgi:hypothetical protein
LRQEHQRIDDDQIFDDRGKGIGSREFKRHHAKLLHRPG